MSTVLLVEDSLTDSKRLTDYLQQSGLTVVSVGSVEEAQEKLHRLKPDLIVLDVILPGQSGFELCLELKTNPVTVSIPVVICSSKGTEGDKLWGNLLGADAYLPKPVDQQQLVQTVQQLLKG
ncbi:response regulator [Leptolyngbya sp. NK1-12]|uniref:Response regulator n=2 Tax=Leptolyngbya sp. NK1-12 TaxID=2547451 RepID=A0AA96WLF5_9CYAN|nr:response regulator [Leptolyngbya sp. NK1-12]